MLNQYLLRYSLVLLVSLLSIAALSQNLRIYPVMDSDPKDFGGRVNCIFQDRIGFIWIGKETGLFRYDGSHPAQSGILCGSECGSCFR
jgi:ligand-binding sensor domain-containing protein